MSRAKKQEEVSLKGKVEILPLAVYTRKEVVRLTGCSVWKIQQAEKNNKLYRTKEGRPLYLGQAVLRWLFGDEVMKDIVTASST